jgi:hypothetical protein
MDARGAAVTDACGVVQDHADAVGYANLELILQLLAQDCREMARRNEEGPADIDVRNIRPECLQPEVDEDA